MMIKYGRRYCEYQIEGETDIKTIYAKSSASAYWQLVGKLKSGTRFDILSEKREVEIS